MKVESKGSYDDDKPQNPKIPEKYYNTELVEIIDYDRDDAQGLILKFKVTDDVELENNFDLEMTDGDVIVPFFAPAKLSYSEDSESSRLTENLMKIGMHEPVLKELGYLEEVMQKDKRIIPETDEEIENFKTVLKGFLAGKTVKVDISYSQSGDESQVNKFSEIVETDSSSEEDSEDDGDDEVIFDDEEDE